MIPSGGFLRLSLVLVKPAQVKLHLPLVRGFEFADLQFDGHGPPQLAVVKQQIKVEILGFLRFFWTAPIGNVGGQMVANAIHAHIGHAGTLQDTRPVAAILATGFAALRHSKLSQ